MKIRGLMLTWNNLEFFKCSLSQVLKFCDELILVEGCHYQKYPKRSTDGTYEYIQNLDHPKLIVRDFNFKGRNNIVQWKIRDSFSRDSHLWKPGNWVVQWDDDIAFFNDDLKRIKKVMATTKYDTIKFKERRFILNFKFNTFTNKVGGYRFNRITKGCFYRPNWKMFYKNDKPYKKYKYLKDVTYFHYVYVKKPERVKFRWELSREKGYTAPVKFYKQYMNIKWKNDEEIYRYKDTIEMINNEKGFNIYRGQHPEIIENHPWKDLEDCREL